MVLFICAVPYSLSSLGGISLVRWAWFCGCTVSYSLYLLWAVYLLRSGLDSVGALYSILWWNLILWGVICSLSGESNL